MGQFYKESRYRNFKRFLKKKGFTLRQDGPHMIATHPDNEAIELSIPRSNSISNGVTEKECEKLIELGYSVEEIKKTILR